jgi:hypothetical protein
MREQRADRDHNEQEKQFGPDQVDACLRAAELIGDRNPDCTSD